MSAARIRWDVKPYIYRMTHPATGVETVVYDAVRVEIAGPDHVAILHSEYPRAAARARRAVAETCERPGRIIVTPIYTARKAAIAYVVAYVEQAAPAEMSAALDALREDMRQDGATDVEPYLNADGLAMYGVTVSDVRAALAETGGAL